MLSIEQELKQITWVAISKLIEDGVLPNTITPDMIVVERTRNPMHGDYTTNIALKLAKFYQGECQSRE